MSKGTQERNECAEAVWPAGLVCTGYVCIDRGLVAQRVGHVDQVGASVHMQLLTTRWSGCGGRTHTTAHTGAGCALSNHLLSGLCSCESTAHESCGFTMLPGAQCRDSLRMLVQISCSMGHALCLLWGPEPCMLHGLDFVPIWMSEPGQLDPDSGGFRNSLRRIYCAWCHGLLSIARYYSGTQTM